MSISIKGVSKRFGKFTAVDGVSKLASTTIGANDRTARQRTRPVTILPQ